MQIAQYFASIGFRVDKKEIRKVDTELKAFEKKLKSFGKRIQATFTLKITSFNFDQKKLGIIARRAIRSASDSVVFEIKNFKVNERSMRAAVAAASRRMSIIGQVGQAAGGSLIVNNKTLSGSEWDRREREKQKLWWERRNALREDEARRAAERMRRPVRSDYSNSVNSVYKAGGVAGVAARAYGPLLAAGFGGYGLAQLNQRNQEVVSAQLQTQAVVQQAGGSPSDGNASFDWLKKQGDRVGFNWLDASGDYNKLISGLTGAGMTVGQGQGVFKGFSELARVNKLDKTSQNRLFRALSQVAGKNQLMSEELTGQIAEALPGGVALFAEAYQRQLAARGEGGGKTGNEAIQELREAMKNRKVRGDILLYAGDRAGEMAAPSLSAASKASQAEQGRFQNAISEAAITASNNGVEEGFARIFRTLNTGLREANPLIESMARGFNESTKWAERLLLWPQSFKRLLEGRDSLVADWLGIDATEQLREDWSQIKVLFDQIAGMKTPDWMPSLEATTKEIAAMLNAIAEFSVWYDRKKVASDATAANVAFEHTGKNLTDDEFEQLPFLDKMTMSLKWGWRSLTGNAGQEIAQHEAYNGGDISPYMGESGFDTGKFWQMKKEEAASASLTQFGPAGYGINGPITKNENTINLDFRVESDNPEAVRQAVRFGLEDALKEAAPQFNRSEF